MSNFENITLAVAIWGAALSTILAIYTVFRDKRSVKVSYKLAITDDKFGKAITLISVEAVNNGHRPVTITSGGLIVSNGRYYIQEFYPVIPSKLPARLQDGESVSIYLDLEKVRQRGQELAQEGEKITGAFVRDAADKNYVVKISKKESEYLAQGN